MSAQSQSAATLDQTRQRPGRQRDLDSGHHGSRARGEPQESRARGGRQESRAWGGRQVSRILAGQQKSRSPGGWQEGRAWGGKQGNITQGGRQVSRDTGGRQEESQAQGGRQETMVQPDREQCRFDGRCERIPNCPFIHSLEDFPPIQREVEEESSRGKKPNSEEELDNPPHKTQRNPPKKNPKNSITFKCTRRGVVRNKCSKVKPKTRSHLKIFSTNGAGVKMGRLPV